MERTTKNTKVSVFLLFFFLFSIIMVSTPVSGELLTGLYFNYPFDEGTGTTSNTSAVSTTLSLNMSSNVWDTGLYTFSMEPVNDAGGALTNMTYNATSVTTTTGLTTTTFSKVNLSFSVWVYIDSMLTNNTIIPIYSQTRTNSENTGILFGVYPLTSNSGEVYLSILDGTGEADDNTYMTSSGIVTTGEWTHIVAVAYGDTGTQAIYVNGILQPSGNLSPLVGMTSPLAGGGKYFIGNHLTTINGVINGRIDELSLWIGRRLTAGEVGTLYNSGNGLLYESYVGVAPAQIANIADQYIPFSAIKDLYFNDYIANYTSASVYFDDLVASATVLLTTDFAGGSIDSYEQTYLKVYLTPIGDDMRVRIKTNTTQMSLTPFNILGSNALGSVLLTPSVIINGTPASFPPPVTLLTPASPITYCSNSNTSRSFNSWFSNYNSVTVSYYDSELVATTTINTTKASATSMSVNADHINVSITPYASNIILRIENGDIPFSTNINMTAFNDYGSTSINFTYIISTTCTGSLQGPKLISEPGMINLEPGEVYNLDFSDYFTGQKWFYVTTYYDSVTNQLAGYDEFDTLYYTLQMTDEGFTITSKTTAFQESFTLYAVNEYGSVWYTQTFNMAESLSTGGETGRGIMDSVLGFLPNAESLTMKERYGYVLVTILVTLLLVIILNFEMKSESGSSSSIFIVLGGVLALLEIIFFVAIGYIPIVIIVILALVGGLIAFMLLKGSGAQGG